GAFTGADSRRIGKFEQCSGGTIFLDEIGDMAPLVQAKVLRLLQQQEFERVGGNETIRTDVRIIAATNRDLEQMVEDDSFREDLFYRLNGLMIELPALRERPEDLLPLLEHFLTRLSHDFNGWNVEGVSPEAVELLRQYHWPGNIRELQSVLRQAIMNASGPVIVPDFLPEDVRNCRRTGTAPPAASDSQPVDGMPHSNLAQFVDQAIARGTDDLYAESLEFMERYLMTRVLRETNGNQSRAAEILGITRGKVANRIQSFGISLENQITLEDRTG
ncbi:MAG: sigma 54-interacting transcriptional regulator, partial [Planctomycetaceae bacterium]|nr:sigma 54-interacting transcriptional regulator [Planctomycetaceae bacterium]